MDIEAILQATAVGETSDWEFKSARGGLPGSLWETYSAMANTDGGSIVLGVEDDGQVSGLTDPAKMQADFWSVLNNRGRVSVNLLSNADVRIIDLEERSVLVIAVPRAPRRQRPVFINQNPLTGTYRRNHEGDYHCNPDEVGRMLADQAEEPADSQIVEGFGLADLDEASLAQYRNRFSAREPQHPWLSEDIPGLLRKLGGWRTDRLTGQDGLTVAGLLMFGKDEAIRDPTALPQYHLDYREKLSEDPDVRWTDRLTLDGKWVGNLFQFYQKVIGRLTEDLKIPFQLEPNLFRKDDTIVHEAIREALVNALIHADYRGQGGIVIEKYPHRIELSNPGTLLVSVEQMIRGGMSECRNKSLQLMFQQIGGGEKAGSGVDKIRQGWASQQWRWPLIQPQTQPDRVTLILSMVSLLPEASLERLRSALGKRFEALKSEQVQALVTADVEGSVTNPRLQQFSATHATDITKMFGGLVGEGLLVKDGYGRWASYRLNPDVFRSGTNPSHKDSNPSHKSGNPSHKELNPPHKDSNPPHKELSPPHKDFDEELLAIAAPSRESERLPPARTEEIIQTLCAGRFLTFQEIGALLNRNADKTRDRFLSRMVADGRLRLKFPEPAHPQQAYTAAPKDTE